MLLVEAEVSKRSILQVYILSIISQLSKLESWNDSPHLTYTIQTVVLEEWLRVLLPVLVTAAALEIYGVDSVYLSGAVLLEKGSDLLTLYVYQ